MIHMRNAFKIKTMMNEIFQELSVAVKNGTNGRLSNVMSDHNYIRWHSDSFPCTAKTCYLQS